MTLRDPTPEERLRFLAIPEEQPQFRDPTPSELESLVSRQDREPYTGPFSEFWNSFTTSFSEQNPEMLGQTVHMFGTLYENETARGMGDDLIAWARSDRSRWTPKVPSFTNIGFDEGIINGLQDTWNYVEQAVGQGLGSMAPAIAGRFIGAAGGGAAGAGIGSAVPGVGTAAGATAGTAVGAFAGGYMPMTALDWGDVYGSLRAEGIDDTTAAQWALPAGAAIALLDVYGLGALTGAARSRVKGHAVRGIARAIGRGVKAEGITEALQQILQEGIAAHLTGNLDLKDRLITVLDAGIQGGLTGGFASGAFATLTPAQPDVSTPDGAAEFLGDHLGLREVIRDAQNQGLSAEETLARAPNTFNAIDRILGTTDQEITDAIKLQVIEAARLPQRPGAEPTTEEAAPEPPPRPVEAQIPDEGEERPPPTEIGGESIRQVASRLGVVGPAQDLARQGQNTEQIMEELAERLDQVDQMLLEGGMPEQARPIKRAIIESVTQEEGTRDRPVVAETEADVARARARVAQPTPAQAEAVNYRKGYVDVQGLPIGIETGKGMDRRGVDPATGQPWAVTMPVDYGDILNTRGADGDPVDVFIGPTPTSSQAWVINQQDPDTQAFDETKVMLGFQTEQEAVEAYERSFSDQRGRERIQDIIPTPVEELRTWLSEGATDQAFARGGPAVGARGAPAQPVGMARPPAAAPAPPATPPRDRLTAPEPLTGEEQARIDLVNRELPSGYQVIGGMRQEGRRFALVAPGNRIIVTAPDMSIGTAEAMLTAAQQGRARRRSAQLRYSATPAAMEAGVPEGRAETRKVTLDTVERLVRKGAAKGAEERAQRMQKRREKPLDTRAGRPASVGGAGITDPGSGVVVAGPVTTDQWVNRVESILSPAEIQEARGWYESIIPLFRRYFPNDWPVRMVGWLLSNVNVSPSGAALNAFRVIEQEEGDFIGPRGGLTDKIVRRLTHGIAPENVSQKIADFLDSAFGLESRSIFDGDPEFGAPFVADIWSARDMGLYDDKLRNRVARRYGEETAGQLSTNKYQGGFTEPAYEWIADRGRELTADLNSRGWLGGELRPHEVQAIGWTAMAKMYGYGETPQQMIDSLSRQISFEVAPGESSPLAKLMPEFYGLPLPAQLRLTTSMANQAIAWAQDFFRPGLPIRARIMNISAWQDYPPAASAQLELIASPEYTEQVMMVLGYLLQQTEVFAHRSISGGKRGAYDIVQAGRSLAGNPEAVAEMWNAVKAAAPELATGMSPVYDGDGNFGIRIVMTDWSRDRVQREAEGIYSKIQGTLATLEEKYNIQLSFHETGVETQSVRNDWAQEPDGNAYLQGLENAGRSDLSRRLVEGRYRDRVEKLARRQLEKLRSIEDLEPARQPWPDVEPLPGFSGKGWYVGRPAGANTEQRGSFQGARLVEGNIKGPALYATDGTEEAVGYARGERTGSLIPVETDERSPTVFRVFVRDGPVLNEATLYGPEILGNLGLPTAQRMSGEQIYQAITDRFGGDKAQTNGFLRSAGYVGYQHTQTSMFDGSRNRNIAVFDPSDVQIAYVRRLYSATPRYQEEQLGVREKIQEIVDRVTGRRAEISWESTITPGQEAVARSGGVGERAAGYSLVTDEERIIGLAMDDPTFDPVNEAGHEAWHVIENLGLVTESEIDAIMRDRGRLEEIVRAENVDPTTMDDYELRAVAFARYRRLRETGQPRSGYLPAVIRIFNKIMDVLRRIRSVLAGQGFETMESVFERARTGEIAAREEVGFAGDAIYRTHDVPEPMVQFSASKRYPGLAEEIYAQPGGWWQSIVTLFRDPRTWPVKFRESWGDFRERQRVNVMQGVLDQYYSLKDREQLFTELTGQDVDPTRSPWMAALLTNDLSSMMAPIFGIKHRGDWAGGTLRYNKKEGTTVLDTSVKPFLQIFEPLTESGDLKDWTVWAAAKRTRSLLDEDAAWNAQNPDEKPRDRDHLFQGIADTRGITRDELLDDILAQGNPQFEAVLSEWSALNSSILDLAEAAGVVNAQQRALWEREDYVPFYRVIEKLGEDRITRAGFTRGIADQASGIRQLRGGEEQMHDLIENMAFNLTKLVDASVKNIAAQKSIPILLATGDLTKIPWKARPIHVSAEEMANKLNDMGIDVQGLTQEQRESYALMFQMVPPKDVDVLSVMVDGKAQYYRVKDPFVMQSMTALGIESATGFMKALALPKKVLTDFVTADPAFALANYIRDSFSVWVTSQEKFIPMLSGSSGLRKAFKNSPSLLAIMAGGGGGGGFYGATPRQIQTMLSRVDTRSVVDSPSKGIDILKRLYHGYDRLLSTTEMANRVSLYDAVKERGGSEIEAVFAAKDIMNFTMRGSWSTIRFLTSTVPFLNARLQGLYRLARGARMNPMRFWTRGAMLLMGTMSLYALNWDSDEYDDLEEWDKDTYYHIFLKNIFGEQALAAMDIPTWMHHIRIPKPFEVGAIFSTVPERAMNLMRGTDSGKVTIQQLGAMFGETFAFNPIPQALKPVVEQWANKSFFTGRPIVGLSLEGLPEEMQYTPRTSETLRLAGEVTGFSPARMESLVRGYFGTVGMYMLSASDILARDLAGYPPPASPRVEQIPILSRFLRDEPAVGTKWLTEHYDLRHDIGEIVRGMNEARFQGDFEMLQQLQQDNQELLRLRPVVRGIDSQLRTINRNLRRIHFSDRTPEEKREAQDRLLAQRNRLVARYRNILRPGRQNDNLEARQSTTSDASHLQDAMRRGDSEATRIALGRMAQQGVEPTAEDLAALAERNNQSSLAALIRDIPAGTAQRIFDAAQS